jgi:phosphoesterase RecJ-like protein
MDDNTEHRLRLLGFALSERMRVLPELGTVIFHLSADELRRFHYQAGDTEGLVNYGLSIQGMRLAVFFMERRDGIKISFRSKGTLPVNELAARYFEGGGHRNAAGGRSSVPLADAITRLEQLLPAFLEAHPE